MGATRKFRHVQANPQVALVIDDLITVTLDGAGPRDRGTAVALLDVTPRAPSTSRESSG